MNCDQFESLIGMRCEPIPMRDGSGAVALHTPFTFFDGDGVEIYATSAGPGVQFFDDGLTLDWLRGAGFRVREDRRRWASIRKAVAPYGVSLSENGCIESFWPAEDAPTGFARTVSAILAVDAWAREHAGIPQEAQWLAEEVAMYLRAWKPRGEFSDRPGAVLGLSGRAHSFDMSLDDELIDAITPHPASTGGELRKLVDVRAIAANKGLAIRVVIDDRRDPDAAGQEAAILGNFAQTWPISRLIQAAGAPDRHQ